MFHRHFFSGFAHHFSTRGISGRADALPSPFRSGVRAVFQAMVQIDTPANAASALQALESQNLFTGCNTLKLQYSTFGELTVH